MMADYLQKSGSGKFLSLLCLLMFNAGLLWQVHAQSLASNLPLNNRGWQAEKVSLKQLLGELEHLYDVKFAFDERLVQDKFVNPEEIEKKELNQVLTQVLQPLRLQFMQLTEKHYVIKKVADEAGQDLLKIDKQGINTPPSVPRQISPQRLSQFQQSIQLLEKTISGTVTDGETGESLPGVNILAKGTTTGTVTDAEGFYRLTVSDNVNTLVFSSIGFLTQEVEIGDRTDIDIALSPDVQSLQEVVVIGYGTVKRSNVTGSVISVAPEELREVPSTNVMEALQGKLPGVDIVRESGQAGANINVRVRGNRSLTANNEPLFIVDGIQYSNIQDLNPNDIASMEVLKDAASTAIYGSRGANGVIIITTKQGTAGETRVNFNAYAGVSQPVNYPQVQTPQQYADFRREAYRAIDEWSSSADDPDIFNSYELDRIQNNGGAIWPDLFLKDGLQQDYQLGVSTGTEKTNFYISLDYFNERGVIRMENLDRYSIRANIDHSISDKLQIGTQNQITYYNQDFRRDPFNIANKINPLLEPYDEEGNLVVYPNNGKDINPLSDEEPDNYANNNRTTRIFTSAYFAYDILDDLSFRSNMGLTLTGSRTGIYRAPATVDRNGGPSEAVYQTGNNILLNWENILNYNKEFGAHSLGVTFVQSLLRNRGENQAAQGFNQLLNYQLFYALGNATEQVSISSGYEESSLLSFSGRIQYGFQDKYLLMLTGRTDGASQLSPGKKWSFFPAVSAAWRIIEEDFMSDADLFSDLKLRASYGVAGNYSVNPYSTQSLLTRIPFGFDESPAFGYTFSNQIGNDDLGWENTTTYNLGLDFGLFQGRLAGTFDIYTATTDNLLLSRLLPPSSGVSRITENIGKTQNRGVEIGLNAVAVQKENLQWNVGVNWFTNQEEILELSTGANDEANGWFIGYPTTSFYDYEKIGIWQSDEADLAADYGQAPGDIRVKDQNNDQRITSSDDRVVVGSPLPKWSANFSSDLKVGNFDFAVQVFARWGQMMEYEYATRYDPAGVENSLQHDYWTPENPTNDYPRPNADRSRDGTLFFSTVQYRDGSFVKLRGATLGYTLPESLTNRLAIGNLRLYVTGRNIFVLSKVDNYDPERGGAMSNPIPRLLVGGINLEF